MSTFSTPKYDSAASKPATISAKNVIVLRNARNSHPIRNPATTLTPTAVTCGDSRLIHPPGVVSFKSATASAGRGVATVVVRSSTKPLRGAIAFAGEGAAADAAAGVVGIIRRSPGAVRVITQPTDP